MLYCFHFFELDLREALAMMSFDLRKAFGDLARQPHPCHLSACESHQPS